MAELGVAALARMILSKRTYPPGSSTRASQTSSMSLLYCQWRRAPALHLTVPRGVSADGQLYWPLAEVYHPMPIKLRTRHLAAKRSGHKCATKEHVQMGAKHQEEQSTVHQQVGLMCCCLVTCPIWVCSNGDRFSKPCGPHGFYVYLETQNADLSQTELSPFIQ